MTEAQKENQASKRTKVEELELNRETLADLTETEAEGAEGGVRPARAATPSHGAGYCCWGTGTA